jgi:hypothetical protein
MTRAEANEVDFVLHRGPPPLFFGCVAMIGLTGAFFGSVAAKGLSCVCERLQSGEGEEKRTELRSQKAWGSGLRLLITTHFTWLAPQVKLDGSAKMNTCPATRPPRSL